MTAIEVVVSQIKEECSKVSTGTGDKWEQNMHENKQKYNKFKEISDNGQTSAWRVQHFRYLDTLIDSSDEIK
jgi:hypothetical protein